MIRFCDIIFSIIGLLLISPLLIIIAIWLPLDSKGPLFYKQVRVGKNGKDFFLYKFRSMRVGSDKKGLITVGEKDSRITKIGYYLRKYKLDELPQLFNVIKGDMSIVGPRPEVRKYVNLYTTEQMKVLSIKPGITDYASIYFINENKILAKNNNPEIEYVQKIMPEKLILNLRYINKYSIKEYIKVIIITVCKIFIR
jgi:lipopolysaccharide/colanic/teichoic acid biosynthesis glycosyltransferase